MKFFGTVVPYLLSPGTKAKKEYLQSQKEVDQEIENLEKEYDNIRKYGYPNPIVSAGGVIC